MLNLDSRLQLLEAPVNRADDRRVALLDSFIDRATVQSEDIAVAVVKVVAVPIRPDQVILIPLALLHLRLPRLHLHACSRGRP